MMDDDKWDEFVKLLAAMVGMIAFMILLFAAGKCLFS
jgi:DMSO/TMAO reductase YedYZ heme-binding membrane subunit